MNGMDNNNNIQNGNVPMNDFNGNVSNNNFNNNVQMSNNEQSFGPVMNNDANNVSEKVPKKSNKFIILIICVLVFLGLGAVGFFSYKSYVTKPIKLYTAAIERLYEEFSESLKEANTFDITKESLVMNGDIKINSNLPVLNDYTKYTYAFDLGLDLNNKKMQLGASMKDESKEIISAIFQYLNNNLYIESSQLYDKSLYTVLEEDIFAELDTESLSVDYKKVDKIVEKLSKYLINALDEDKFIEKDGKVKINGKDVKVTKVIYPINQDTMYDMAKSILNDIKNDEEFIELIRDLPGVDENEINDFLSSAEVKKENFEMDEDAEFYIYKKGFFPKVIGFGLSANGGESVLSYAKVDEHATFELYAEELEIVATTVGDKTEGSLKSDGKELFKFTFIEKVNGKNTSLDLNVTSNFNGVDLALDYSSNTTEVNDKKSKGTFDINLKVSSQGESIEVGAKINSNVEIGGKFKDINTAGAVDIDTLDEVELNKISTNLENALKDTFLYELIFVSPEIPVAPDIPTIPDDFDSDEDFYFEFEEDFEIDFNDNDSSILEDDGSF